MISLPPRSQGESRLDNKRGVLEEDSLLSDSGKDLNNRSTDSGTVGGLLVVTTALMPAVVAPVTIRNGWW